MSRHSPCVIEDSETLTRFIVSPLHVDKQGRVKPAVFSHVFSRGLSIQREQYANDEHSLEVVKQLIGPKDDRVWLGVYFGQCRDVRNIVMDDSDRRAVCVYDTANANNPSHGELFQSQYVVDDADRNELRHNLFVAFGSGSLTKPVQYRNGAVWNRLPQNLQVRK